jgi:hypothetical protein
MEDACTQIMSDRQLQRYFAQLIYNAVPVDPAALLKRFLDKLCPIPAVNAAAGQIRLPMTVEQRRNKVLKNLEYYLRCFGSSCRYTSFYT